MKRALLALILLVPNLAQASGLARTAAGALRNAYTNVKVTVDGDIARTVVTQVFVNDLPSAAEATYTFPLPADAAVTGFASFSDGRRLDAKADDRENAAKTYEKAADEGRKAGLAESEGESRFKMKLGAIPAHGTRRTELTYAQTLAQLGGERSYVFPAGKTEAAPPPTLLDLEVAMVSDQPILSATSLNHPDARLERSSANQWIARLHRAHDGLERDLALRWQQPASSMDLAARAVRVHKDEPAFVEARIAFNADPVPLLHQPVDVVMVVDASLSMAGEPLERARKLAEGVLGGLTSADRMNLVSFNDEVTTLHGGMVPAHGAMLAMTRDAIGKLRAHGRSNLEAALDEAALLLKGSPRGLLVLMTDGQPTVGELYEGGAATRKDFANTRVVIAHFNYPSRKSALEALFPSVTTRYVPDGPAGDEAVGELTRLAVAPTIEGLEMLLIGPTVSHLEGAIPTRLAVGESVRLMARADGDLTLRMSGRLHVLEDQLEQRIVVPAEPDGRGDRGLAVEWARMRVRNLESRIDAGAPPAELAQLSSEIRSLGKDYNLMTRFTSFVVTDSLSPDRIKPGDPEIRIRAPRSALGVRAILPWGEVVECAWQPDEELWLGRFLVPRGVVDGLYRVRVFVDAQAGTLLRGTLFFQVDSRPPTFVLSRDGAGPVERGSRVLLTARVKDGVFDKGGDAIVRDRIDLKHIVVRVGDTDVPLQRAGETEVWQAGVVLDLAPGHHVLRLLTTDFASNTSETSLAVEVR